ncbi:MAG: endonuclease/exonuclease/phosphatase family metal-dependent hydrolase [Saprospiraceae bacterium]
MSEFFFKILRILNIAVIFITFGAYLAPYISPQTTWFFAIFGLFYPVLLALNILFFLFWLWRKKWYAFYSLGCILLGWTHFTGLMGFNLAQPKPTEPLTVVSYNSHSLLNLFPQKKDNSIEQKAFKERLEKKVGEVEILCLQEFRAYKNTVKKLKTLLNLPHFEKYGGRGTAIFSKYPIIKKGEIKFKNTANSCLWIDVEVDKKVVRVYSIHFESSKISGDAAVLTEDVNLRDKKTWQGIKGILGKYKRSTNTRVDQMLTVKEHISNTPHPVIVCGDFNDTPVSYVYEQMSKGLCDHFKEAGRGWGATYNGSIPMLRIDYIFTEPENFTVYEHGILKEEYSDHYPVYSQLKLK